VHVGPRVRNVVRQQVNRLRVTLHMDAPRVSRAKGGNASLHYY
jgi:hypothetical protein